MQGFKFMSDIFNRKYVVCLVSSYQKLNKIIFIYVQTMTKMLCRQNFPIPVSHQWFSCFAAPHSH
jgi:hypothetical protein